MIIDERTYTLHPGKVGDYFRLYQAEGLEIQKRILGNLLGYFSTETGTLNQIVHLWGYESLEDRTRRRAELGADPGWQAYIPKITVYLRIQENRILIPAPFSPIR